MILQHLTDAEVITLMLSCSRFWHDRNGNGDFGRVWRRMTLPDEKDLCKTTARFYILRMLEYDGLLQGNFCCWGCMKTHKQRAFSSDELKKPVDLTAKQDFHLEEVAYRSCRLTTKRKIWFGLCSEMNFVELRHAFANPHPQHLRNGKVGIQDPSQNSNVLLQGYSSLNRKTMYIEYRFRLARTRDVPSYRSYRRHARAVDFPLCTHIRVGYWQIDRVMYFQPLTVRECMNCLTKAMLNFSQGHAYITVRRYVGSLQSPTDPMWKAQTYKSRHKRLNARALAFCDWYDEVISPSNAEDEGLKRFKSKRIRRPFEGVWYAPFIEKCERQVEIIRSGNR